MASKNDILFCEKCKKTMRADEFYKTYNLEKYPTGYLSQCKKCVTMYVDNWDPQTYIWILQECDVPYIPDEWNKCLQSFAQDPSKVTGTTIVGRYLSKMKLKQYKDYRWKDTEFLQQVANKRIEDTMKRQGYDAAEIATVINQGYIPIPEGGFKEPEPAEKENYYQEPQVEDTEFNEELTDEDKRYLRLKWGKSYKPEEWVRLEQLYQEMTESYDIQGAGHEDILKMVCKTSLKANQLLDIGDVDGAQKMVKMYDSLMKSGKFTAAQNKAESGEFVDSVGEIIELCEKQGYIERFYIESPNDKVDFTIKDMQRYTQNLVNEETNLSTLIEQAIKQNLKEDKESAANNENEIVDDDDLFEDNIEKELTDKDFKEFSEFEEEEELNDSRLMKLLSGGEFNGS